MRSLPTAAKGRLVEKGRLGNTLQNGGGCRMSRPCSRWHKHLNEDINVMRKDLGTFLQPDAGCSFLIAIMLTSTNPQAGAGGGGPPAEPATPRDFGDSGQEPQLDPACGKQPQPDPAPGEQPQWRRWRGYVGEQPMPRAEADVSCQALVCQPLKVRRTNITLDLQRESTRYC